MSVIPMHRAAGNDESHRTDVDIVLPVFNEGKQLTASVTTLRRYLDTCFPFSATVTVADNASTDDTAAVAARLAGDLPGVQALHVERKGRGRALRTAWSASRADVVAYMDVDLATGLDALLPLVAPLLSGHSDVAVGTRLAPGAHVVRGTRRELLSRGYNLLLRTALVSGCTDAQCGFKAVRREVAGQLLPFVRDDEWFFDTELLVTARRLGLRIHEVPVDWVDDLDSRVELVDTIGKDLRGVGRMLLADLRNGRRGPAVELPAPPWAAPPPGDAPTPGAPTATGPGTGPPAPAPPTTPAPAPDAAGAAGDQVSAEELVRFAGVGVLSTVACTTLFALGQPVLGPYLANGAALVVCSLGNTAAHRGMAGAAAHGLDRGRRLLTAAGLLGVSLAFTTGALGGLAALGVHGLAPELAAVTVANLAAAGIRFGLLRTWVFRPQFGTRLAPAGAPGGPPALFRPCARTEAGARS